MRIRIYIYYIKKIVFYYTGETKERKRFIFLNIVKKNHLSIKRLTIMFIV